MIFKATPNLYVRISNKYVQRATGKKGFYFDANGEYETDNEVMIKVLSQNFEVVEEIPFVDEEVEEVEPVIEEVEEVKKPVKGRRK